MKQNFRYALRCTRTSLLYRSVPSNEVRWGHTMIPLHLNSKIHAVMEIAIMKEYPSRPGVRVSWEARHLRKVACQVPK